MSSIKPVVFYRFNLIVFFIYRFWIIDRPRFSKRADSYFHKRGILMPFRTKIIELLERDARITPADIAVMINEDAAAVQAEIDKMEQEGIILGYKALINPERAMQDKVACVIEVSVMPERGHGFDKIAERIYRFPEVKSVFLVSGGYDLQVVIEGKTMREIADFVIDKLSTLPNVRSTASHFLLKKYKEMGTILVEHTQRDRMPVTP